MNVEEVNNNVIDSVDDTMHNLDDDDRKIAERLNELTQLSISIGKKTNLDGNAELKEI